MEHVQETFGHEVLSAHFESTDHRTRAGSVADCLTVLLNHWRRVSNSKGVFDKFLKRLDHAQGEIMMKLFNHEDLQEPSSSSTPANRSLQVRPSIPVSEVSLDSHGLVNITPLKKRRRSKSEDLHGCSPCRMDSSGLPNMNNLDGKMSDLDGSAAAASPPSTKKEEWKEIVAKKPATAEKKKLHLQMKCRSFLKTSS